jgi:hypothetical protein
MTTDQDDAAAWEPTAAIVISGVTAVAGLLGLIVAGSMLTGPRDRGMEGLGDFVVTMAVMGCTLVVNVIGMITAGIGLSRAKNRGVRTPALNVTFVGNLVEFFLVFALPTIMGRV